MNNNRITAKQFISQDHSTDNAYLCYENDRFIDIETKLYENRPDLEDRIEYFLANGNKVKRFKTIKENGLTNYNHIVCKVMFPAPPSI